MSLHVHDFYVLLAWALICAPVVLGVASAVRLFLKKISGKKKANKYAQITDEDWQMVRAQVQRSVWVTKHGALMTPNGVQLAVISPTEWADLKDFRIRGIYGNPHTGPVKVSNSVVIKPPVARPGQGAKL